MWIYVCISLWYITRSVIPGWYGNSLSGVLCFIFKVVTKLEAVGYLYVWGTDLCSSVHMNNARGGVAQVHMAHLKVIGSAISRDLLVPLCQTLHWDIHFLARLECLWLRSLAATRHPHQKPSSFLGYHTEGGIHLRCYLQHMVPSLHWPSATCYFSPIAAPALRFPICVLV